MNIFTMRSPFKMKKYFILLFVFNAIQASYEAKNDEFTYWFHNKTTYYTMFYTTNQSPKKGLILNYLSGLVDYYKEEEINLPVIAAIIDSESSYRNCIMHPGEKAIGLMGIKEIAFKHFQMFNPSSEAWKYSDLYCDWKKNIIVGVWVYRTYLLMAKNNIPLAYTYYRFGPHAKFTNNKYAKATYAKIKSYK